MKEEEKKNILNHIKETYRIYKDIYILNLYLDREAIKYFIELIQNDLKRKKEKNSIAEKYLKKYDKSMRERLTNYKKGD